MSLEIPPEIQQQVAEEERVQHAEWLYSTEVEELAGLVNVTFPNLNVPIELKYDKFYEGTRYTAEADLEVYYRRSGRERPLFTGRLALRGPQKKKQAADYCSERASSFDRWGEVVENGCEAALRRFREGTPFKDIRTVERRKELEYVVWPVIPRKNPTVIFGTGGLGKSLLGGCYMGVRAALGPEYNATIDDGLLVHKQYRVGYLDWEADEDEVRDRWASIADGLQVPEPFLAYERVHGSLAGQIHAIRNKVLKDDIDFLVIDSALPASGGQAESAEAVGLFYDALGALDLSSIIIAHQAKAQIGFTSNTPFGSTFWWNEARSVWHIAAEQDEQPGVLEVGLFHKKANSGRKHEDLGFRIEFHDAIPGIEQYGYVKVQKLNLDKSELRSNLSIPKHILAILDDRNDNPDGEMTVEEIEVVGESLTKKQIQENLSRLKRRGVVYNNEKSHKWGREWQKG